MQDYQEMINILTVTRIEIRNEYFVDSDDIFRSVNVTLTILLCKMIFFHHRERGKTFIL